MKGSPQTAAAPRALTPRQSDMLRTMAEQDAPIRMSPSGLRTRRHELAVRGLVVDSGLRHHVTGQAGRVREHIIWRLAAK